MSSPPRAKVLVSACLLGRRCRYDGDHNRDLALEEELSARGEEALPFCPEEAAGLPTPRPPIWIERESATAVLEGRDRIVSDRGEDVTTALRSGAEQALAECRAHGATKAYLKERSPSCGVASTHVADVLVPGPGLAAALLAREGIEAVGVEGRRAARES